MKLSLHEKYHRKPEILQSKTEINIKNRRIFVSKLYKKERRFYSNLDIKNIIDNVFGKLSNLFSVTKM